MRRFRNALYSIAVLMAFTLPAFACGDPDISIPDLTKKAESGDAQAQYELGLEYIGGVEVDQDYEKALYWFLKSAAKGHAHSLYQVGLWYEYNTAERDAVKAFEWYLKAAHQGIVAAQEKVGDMLKEGVGVEKNPTQAFEWYLKSAQQGYPMGQLKAGDMYFRGQGIEQDFTKSIKWFQETFAHGGHSKAKHKAAYRVGLHYKLGLGVVVDKRAAFNWFMKAANLGNEFAQAKISNAYRHGDGVQSNLVEAYKWAEISEVFSFSKAKKMQQDLHEQMTKEQIEKASAMTRKWLKQFGRYALQN